MRTFKRILVLGAVALVSSLSSAQTTVSHELDAFNQKFTDAIRHMDNAAVVSLWADDGTTLLPGMAPVSGKAAIQKFMDDVTSKTTGYKVISQNNEWHDIQVSADWASEWANTTQVVQPPDNKPTMTIHGKMLLVLHHEKDGWRIKQECWTSSPS